MTQAPDSLLRALTDAGELGLVMVAADRRVVLWNAWFAKAAGIPCDTAQGRTLAEVFPDLAGSRIEGAVAEAIENGMSAILSSSLNKKLFPLWREGRSPEHRDPMQQIVVVKPLAAEGARSCLIQVFDVTSMAAREAMLRQQARTMEALAENYRLSELHNRAIVDHTADAIVTFGEDGAIGTYNPAAERMFGWNPYEVVGKPVSVLIPGLTGGDGRPAIDAFLDARTEVVARRRTGEGFALELSLSAMQLSGQRLFIAIGHDITDRKAAEGEILSQREWLTTLIDAMPDVVCFK
ncbi:MAG: PAS domain S-box protein, partial [Actinomycetota bacterium]